MSYTGLVDWYAGAMGAAGRRPTPRGTGSATALPVALPDIPATVRVLQGAGSATPSYGGLGGWYAAVVAATERPAAPPVALPALPRAA